MMLSIFVAACAALGAAAAGFWTLRSYALAGGARRSSALAIAFLVLVSAAALTVALGRPGLPGQPYAQRLAALESRDASTYTPEEWIARLTAEARRHPQDARPLVAQGMIFASLSRPQDAARAFDAALRRDGQSLLALIGLGRALVAVGEGRVSPEALAVFEEASRLSPEDPVPVLYQAMAAQERGDAAQARALWRRLYELLPEDDPRRAMAAAMAAGRGGPASGR